jgi:hypothetical protein
VSEAWKDLVSQIENCQHVTWFGSEFLRLRDVLITLAAERDAARAERDEAMGVIRDLRRKLAVAGVEGSPPPGQDTTIGSLRAEVERLRAVVEADERRLRMLAGACPENREPLPEALGCVEHDVYHFAFEAMGERNAKDLQEASDDDMLEGFRRLIDAWIAAARAAKGGDRE